MSLVIVGIGPGHAAQCTPEATEVLSGVTDVVGYGPYVARLFLPLSVRLHVSDNREEGDRSRHALSLAMAADRRVAVVSGGDAGVFGMASAVFEAMEAGPPEWRGLDVTVVPGVSAVLAVAARLGAPLGGDFCVLSLSDNLKPWSCIRKRLLLAAEGGFVIALYNPRSKARPWQLEAAFEALRTILPPDVPVALARAVGRVDERLTIASLAEIDAENADMRTLVLVGTGLTRRVAGKDGRLWLYTPRFVPA